MVRYLIYYDIKEDPLRTQVSDICKNFGMERIQYSVFLGDLSSSERKEIEERFREIKETEKLDIQILRICESCYSTLTEIVILGPEEVKIEAKKPKVYEYVIVF